MQESLSKLVKEIEPNEEMSSSALRTRAKEIASIGIDHFKDGLLDKCLDVSRAIAAFAEELDNPS